MSYQEWQVKLAPPWLQQPKGAAFLAALGLLKDSLIADLKLGVAQRMPDYALSDALGEIGIDRGIARSPAEAPGAAGDIAYRKRLKQAWTTWQWAGTPLSLLTALSLSGYASNAILIQQNLWAYSLDANGNLVKTTLPQYAASGPWGTAQALFDLGQATAWAGSNPPLNGQTRSGDTNGQIQNKRWSRYMLLFPTPLPSGWSPVTPLTSSTAPTLAQVDGIRRLIQQWGPGGSNCIGITALISGNLWGWPPVTFASFASSGWPTSSAVTWSPTVGSAT